MKILKYVFSLLFLVTLIFSACYKNSGFISYRDKDNRIVKKLIDNSNLTFDFWYLYDFYDGELTDNKSAYPEWKNCLISKILIYNKSDTNYAEITDCQIQIYSNKNELISYKRIETNLEGSCECGENLYTDEKEFLDEKPSIINKNSENYNNSGYIFYIYPVIKEKQILMKYRLEIKQGETVDCTPKTVNKISQISVLNLAFF